MRPVVRVDLLEKAIEEWAAKYAKSFEDHGLPEGQEPEDWANEVLLDAVLDNEMVANTLAEVAKAKFLIACAARATKRQSTHKV